MTEDTAVRMMSRLVVCTNGWDNDSVDVWVAQLQKLHDETAAVRAVEALIDTWADRIRPPWGRLMEHYRAVPRDDPPALAMSSAGKTMSFAEHLHTLKARAAMGDQQAARELESWKHHAGSSSVFMTVVDGVNRRLVDEDVAL